MSSVAVRARKLQHRRVSRKMEKLGLLFLLPLLTCANKEGARLHLQLHSFRNETQHRLLLAQLQSAGSSDQRVFLDVALSEENNERLHTVTLTAQTAVQPSEHASPTRKPQACSLPGYEPLAGAPGLYKLYRRAVTWLEARAACAAEGAHLMVPETEAEALATAQLFARTPLVPDRTGGTYLHIGINDQESEGNYVTETGKNFSSLEYKKWHTGQPTGSSQMNGIVIDWKGELYDIDNSAKQAFMCESPNTP